MKLCTLSLFIKTKRTNQSKHYKGRSLFQKLSIYLPTALRKRAVMDLKSPYIQDIVWSLLCVRWSVLDNFATLYEYICCIFGTYENSSRYLNHVASKGGLGNVVGTSTHCGFDVSELSTDAVKRFSLIRTRPDLPSDTSVEWSGRGVDHPPDLALVLKKEYSYTSTPYLCLQ